MRVREINKNHRAGRTGQHDMYAHEIEAGGIAGGIAREPQK